MNIIVLAIPVFFIFILLEIIISYIKKQPYYRVNDSICSISTGIISRIIGVMLLIIPFSIYQYFFTHFAVISWSKEEATTWVAAFVLYDFFYYWFHRYAHEVNILWASHVVHHQSEEFNLSTALRQTSTSAWFGWFFYLPMAVLGIEPMVIIVVGGLNLIYQFFVHTQLVGKLSPWIEAVFVTPSLHGVHHGQNTRYIDKNYAGVFIVWDRMFNTYQVELDDEKPVYGVRKALASWNPVWANIEPYYRLAEDAWHTKSWQNKVSIWFKPTGWRPDDVLTKVPRQYTNPKNLQKFEINLPFMGKVYVSFQHILIIALSIYFLILAPDLSTQNKLIAGLALLINMFILSLVQEKRIWAFSLELFRLIICFILIFILKNHLWWHIFSLVLLLASLTGLWHFYRATLIVDDKGLISSNIK